MIRWRRIIGVLVALFALHTGTADAASPWARAVLVSCDRDLREAVFEGRVVTVKRAAKMQMRFTLQVSTPESPRWRKVAAPSWGEWITVPPSFAKYTYSKTVQDLLPPANYRAVVNFRWKDRKGRTLRSERAVSTVCKQPDTRPDLVVRDVRFENGQYVATVFNRGRDSAAGHFAVDFIVDGLPFGTVEIVGLAAQTAVTAVLPGGRCAPGTPLEAVVDPRSEVDEADEENDSLSTSC
jgi:CARDB